MFEKSSTGLRRNRVYAETVTESVTLRCATRHLFTAEIYSALNTATDPEALTDLAATGMQKVPCPLCGVDCPIAEPVILHDPQNRRFALYIPAVLAHRELVYRASLLAYLATAEQHDIPAYFGDFVTLVGVPSLMEWKALSDLRPRMRKDPTGSGLKKPSGYPRGEARGEKPAIHEAFADLDDRDSDSPMPRTERSPLYPGQTDFDNGGGDWLDDAAFTAAQHALSSGLLSPFDLERRMHEQRPAMQQPKAPVNPGKGGIPRKKLPGE